MAMVKKQSSFGDYFDAQYDRLRKMLDNNVPRRMRNKIIY